MKDFANMSIEDLEARRDELRKIGEDPEAEKREADELEALAAESREIDAELESRKQQAEEEKRA